MKPFVAFLAGGGVFALAWAASAADPAQFAGFFLAGVVTKAVASHVRKDVITSLGNVVDITGMLVGGPALAIASAAGGGVGLLRYHLIQDRGHPLHATKAIFNFGENIAVAGVSSVAYVSISGGFGDVAAMRSPNGFAALFVAALLYVLLSSFLVALAIRMTTRDRIWTTAKSFVAEATVAQLLQAGLAVLAAGLLLELGTVSLAFLLVPALVAHYGLRGYDAQTKAYDSLVRTFVKAIEVKDSYTCGHAERVAELAEAVAKQMDLPYEEQQVARYAALLHDVGKIAISTKIINKAGPLDEREFREMHLHPVTGVEMLADVEFLRPALDAIRHHHERMDGRGYPYGVSGEDLSPLARIIIAVDAFDAMTSTRTYRRASQIEEALSELDRCAGRQFDPVVVDALRAVVGELGWEPTHELIASDWQVPVVVSH